MYETTYVYMYIYIYMYDNHTRTNDYRIVAVVIMCVSQSLTFVPVAR